MNAPPHPHLKVCLPTTQHTLSRGIIKLFHVAQILCLLDIKATVLIEGNFLLVVLRNIFEVYTQPKRDDDKSIITA